MKRMILFFVISYIFISCTDKKNETHEKKETQEKKCEDYKISDIPIDNIIAVSSENSSTYYFITNHKTSKCIWRNYTKKEVRESYYQNKEQLDNNVLIVYFTLFGIMKDTVMLHELKQYVSLAEKNGVPKESKNNPYYFAKTSIDEIEGVEPSVIDIEPDK